MIQLQLIVIIKQKLQLNQKLDFIENRGFINQLQKLSQKPS